MPARRAVVGLAWLGGAVVFAPGILRGMPEIAIAGRVTGVAGIVVGLLVHRLDPGEGPPERPS